MSAWKSDESTSQKVTVRLPSGSTVEVNDTDPFAETVRKIARGAGLSKFNVKIDGDEIESSEAPNDFSDIDEVEIVKYDEGA